MRRARVPRYRSSRSATGRTRRRHDPRRVAGDPQTRVQRAPRRALADVAKSDAPQDLKIAAVARIDDGAVLRGSRSTTSKEVGLAAVDKIDDPTSRASRRRRRRCNARKIVGEIEEAEREEARHLRRRQAAARRRPSSCAKSTRSPTFDFVKAARSSAPPNAKKLEADHDTDERFAKTVERF
jgi:hypothetical protein